MSTSLQCNTSRFTLICVASVIKNLIRDDRSEIIAIAVLLLFLINWNNAISSQLAGKIVHNPQLAHSNSLSLSLSRLLLPAVCWLS